MEDLEAQIEYSAFNGETESVKRPNSSVEGHATRVVAPAAQHPNSTRKASAVAKSHDQDSVRSEHTNTPYAEAFNRMGRMLKDSGIPPAFIQQEQAKIFELIIKLKDEKQEDGEKKPAEKSKGPTKRLRGVKNTHAGVEEAPAHAAAPTVSTNVGLTEDEEDNVAQSDVLKGARPSF